MDISNKYSIIGLLIGFVVTFFLGLLIGLLVVGVIGLIIYLINNKSMDDATNFWMFGVIASLVAFVILLIVL